MKKIIIILAIILLSFTKNFAQLYNKGAQIVVQNGIVLKVEGDFLNDINSNFKNESKVIVNGNVTNNQTMGAQTAGLWEFTGATSQTFSGIYPLQVFDINFNNGAGFLLNNGMKIYNHANFTNGLVTNTDASVIIFGSNATMPTIPTDASHVAGPVAKEGNASFTFPVGDANKYQPIKADFTQNTSGLLAKYATGVLSKGSFGTTGTEATALTGINDTEYWDLQPFNEGNTTAQITIFWDGYRDAQPNDVSQRRVAHRVGSSWLNEGQSSTAIGTLVAGSVKSNLVSDWSPFALGFVTATPLPLNLLSFSGKKIDTGNQLNWLTSNEIGVSHFEIEKSENGKTFDKIGETKANGGPAENVSYEYLDQQNSNLITHNSSLFYRLKMIDLDGKYSYSKIISIKNESSNSNLKLYPNPAVNKLSVENFGENKIEIISLTGQIKTYNTLNSNELKAELNIADLPTGMYLLRAGKQTVKFLKQ
jgi:Secretion system C-terminal sorting domain